MQIAGRYPPPPGEPDIIGLELSGTTEGTGEAVCALVAGGGHAEYVAAPAGQGFPAPAGPHPLAAPRVPGGVPPAVPRPGRGAGPPPGATRLVDPGPAPGGAAASDVR